MNEVRCPHCGKAFTIDEAGYADIVKQVRDREFESALHERLEFAAKDKASALEVAEAKAKSELEKAAAAKDSEIQKLQALVDGGRLAQEMAVKDALATVEKERDEVRERPGESDEPRADDHRVHMSVRHRSPLSQSV